MSSESGRGMMNKHSRRLPLATGLAAFLTIVCSAWTRAEPPAVPELDCVIEPQQVVKLATPVVGVISRIDVDRGDAVRKDQVLGKLEDGLEEVAVKLARARATNEFATKAVQARLEYLRRKNARAGQLVAKAIVAQATAEEADADANVAEQQLKGAELNLAIARLAGHR